MRVCIVSLNIVPYFRPERGAHFGGAEVQAAAVGTALREAGCDVVFVTSDARGAEDIPFESINAFHSDRGVRGLRFLHPRITGIRRALAAAKADVYYQRNAGMVTGIVAQYCRRHRVPFVYGAGSNTDFDRGRVRIADRRDRFLYFYGLSRATEIVVQNAAQATACQEQIGRTPRVIPNVVSVDTAQRVSDGTVLWVGHLTRVKRPEIFVALARRTPHLSFAMVGGPTGGEADFGREIMNLAADIPNLEITGAVSRSEALTRLAGASVLVNTSAHEGFPNTFLEAWSVGVPVVSMVDVDDILVSGEAGIHCADPDQLSEAIAGIVDDGAQRTLLGARGLQLVEERYSTRAVSPKYMDLFAALTNGASAK